MKSLPIIRLGIGFNNQSYLYSGIAEQYRVPVEFHVSRQARRKYQFDLSMFTSTGNVIFANFHAARLFAKKMNETRDLVHHPEQAVSAAELNALGLIDEILHSLIARYRQQVGAPVFEEALEWLAEQLGEETPETVLHRFVEEFPPLEVYQGKTDVKTYLQGKTEGIPNRQIALEELLLLRLANLNPAFKKYAELFDDTPLQQETPYLNIITNLETYFEDQPPLILAPGSEGKPLLSLLKEPFMAAPESLPDQLRYIKEHWGAYILPELSIKQEMILGEAFLDEWGVPRDDFALRILRSLDFVTEEQKIRFNPAWGPAPTEVPEFYQDEEPEQFSPDMHWMPRLVLIAKSTFVWLDQLSRQYQRSITRLDEIPDEELDRLARWGFTGLWLIGVWERSQASKKIKQLCGNPEAESSAYSLYDYQIAQQLGGVAAYQNLKERCWQRGIRLASDMVPNHTGIDAKWVMEHPDWFIQLPYPPFPSYTYNGPDLSWNPDVAIFIEDHYYDRSDAAVVFKRQDKRTGEVRYIYHGNDGTSMPWNDTAQLDYTKAEVREAVIQTIIHVAKHFPIIRFDAAMTLAKRHFHRLWYPPPGSGGDIPSRAEHGMTRAQFDALMPKEFWREVVDRVAEEAPDTLLLAEAFWLMEGYFVRTLGMHRVYNSAFMHMLKNEENQKYRNTIKNTIEFDPEILKRYVNFMNNPDEDTAIEQFGDGDKYFGVCTLLVTLPGLPMFGHGQIEGYREKYGMEYRRAYWDEHPNQFLIARHEREIFPLLKKRYLFADVAQFLLYDFYLENGGVDENVFAYSNRYGEERALVVFHNAYRETGGWIRLSAAYAVKTAEGEEKVLVQKTLGEGLDISNDENDFLVFRDHLTGLEYIHPCRMIHERGLFLKLYAYEYHVFLDFRVIRDDAARRYSQLAASLQGQGVANVEAAAQELYLRPLHEAFREVIAAGNVQQIISLRRGDSPENLSDEESFLSDTTGRYTAFLETVKQFESVTGNADELRRLIHNQLRTLLRFTPAGIVKLVSLPRTRQKPIQKFMQRILDDELFAVALLFNWIIVHRMGQLKSPVWEKDSADVSLQSRSWMDRWLLPKVMKQELNSLGMDNSRSDQIISLVKLLTTCQHWYVPGARTGLASRLLEKLFREPEFQGFVQVNEFDGVLWFNKEAFETAVDWLFVIEVFQSIASVPESALIKDETPEKTPVAHSAGKKPYRSATKTTSPGEVGTHISRVFSVIQKWQTAEKNSGYRVDKLLSGKF